LSKHVGLHGAPFGMQHCPLGSQTCPELQPQLIIPPHPLDMVPQATPLHAAGEQQFPVGSHTSAPQPGGQEIIWLQPLSTDTLHRPPHGFGFGVQQVPASQIPPLAHSPLLPQFTG
jgi:hypothetical protein